MTLHTLKIKSEYYMQVHYGNKKFELRKNDRNYQVGDLINFNIIYDNGGIEETSEIYVITYILKDTPEYGLAKGYCILSLERLKRNEIH